MIFSDVDVDKIESSDPEESLVSSILPPCNREASNVTDVYDINDIVPKEILKTLFEVEMETVESSLEG